ncbi:hypothetical protein [uncultured Sphingomonas sp.]|uniref:tetratricopeptide repeat protein n=1 Tax=uncultured Sphingomonas sp. TaxID=158754 RepID=UPI0025E87683|nr:hypothetical protein [uncultured Sphingomonas sp.]
MNAFVLLAALSAPTVAQDAPPQETKTVVVTAKSLKSTETALNACISRKCPPKEEIDAALAHAENLFVEGEYKTARRTLLNTIGRVDKYAAQYPTEVADIWRAQARIASHLGEADPMRIGQFEAIEALKAGLDRGDARVLAQRLEIADVFAKQGRIDAARDGYMKVAREAEKLDLPRLQGTALLRVAILDNTLAEVDPALFGPRSRASINRLADTTDPRLAAYREAARLLKVRNTVKSDDPASIDRAVADYTTQPTARPLLVYAPPIDLKVFDQFRPTGATTESRPMQNYDGQWIDVTFLIGADGKVRDVELARESPKLDNGWVKPVTDAIAGRRYAPVKVPDGIDGIRRVERFTLTSFFNDRVTGSRMRSRTAPRIETLDLTADAAPTPQPAKDFSSAPTSVPAD